MRVFYFLAMVMAILIFAAHTFMGTFEILVPMREAGMDPLLNSFVAVIWHLISVALAGFALLHIWLWRRPEQMVAWALVATYAGFVGVFLYYGISDLGTVWLMPQWLFFVICGGLLLVPLLKRKPALGLAGDGLA